MKRFTPSLEWQPEVFDNPVYQSLTQRFAIEQQNDWPSCAWLNQFISSTVLSGQSVRFVENAALEDETRYYEAIIYETGQVPTRENNWHDLFGALIWCLFPKTKALLNALHIADIQEFGLKVRTPARNAITLWDECGVLVVTTEKALIHSLQQHQWHHAFVECRELWGTCAEAVMFGHANYEMMTAPFDGLTGKLLPVYVDASYFSQSWDARYAYLDEILYQHIKEQHWLKDNKQMSPLPILGIPGWWEANNDPSYYNNTDYFRPKRK